LDQEAALLAEKDAKDRALNEKKGPLNGEGQPKVYVEGLKKVAIKEPNLQGLPPVGDSQLTKIAIGEALKTNRA
jgi:hypothetical protein